MGRRRANASIGSSWSSTPGGCPCRDTPVFLPAFQRAKRWVASTGALVVEHAPPPSVTAGAPIALSVRAVSDPLAMVWGFAS